MDESLFTVYFDDPYWVGVFELTADNTYATARVVFGAEPTDAQILEYLFKNYPNNVISRSIRMLWSKGPEPT